MQPKSWQRNQQKKNRQEVKEYTTSKGKIVKDRLPKESPQCKCRYLCGNIITEEERFAVNRQYWGLGAYGKQQVFLAHNITTRSCKRSLVGGSRRSNTRTYTLGEKQVCKKFFMATLNISDGAITVACNKARQGVSDDFRGRHGLQRKTDEDTVALIKQHIESFPAV